MTNRAPLSSSLSRLFLLALFALAGCAALAVAAPAARADATIVVDTTSDESFLETSCEPLPATTSCTLREAIELVNEGEGEVEGAVTIELDAEGTIELENEELELDPALDVEEVAIRGPGADKLTISGGDEYRVLAVEGIDMAVISGLTIAHGLEDDFAVSGDGGGGIWAEFAELVLEEVHLTENAVGSNRRGGAIALEFGAGMSMSDSVVDHNESRDDAGGAIYMKNGGLTDIAESTIENNSADEEGGAIATDSGKLAINNSTIANNHAGEEGGGIWIGESAEEAVFETIEVLDNSSGDFGGGIASEANFILNNSTLAGNSAASYGGGIYATEDATVERSTVSGNSIPNSAEPEAAEEEGGGGIAIADGETIHVLSSTVADNVGGGIEALNGEAVVRNSTIAGNSTAGGIAGAGIEGEEGFEIESSIVAGNTAAGRPADCWGSIDSLGHNLVGTVGNCGWEDASGDQLGVDPELGSLADNGGPTETMAPVSLDSPAINSGSNPPASDQRGFTRPVPAGAANTDVGAIEVQAPIAAGPPTILEPARVVSGETLTCEPGEWSTDTVTDPSFAYVWRADGAQVGTGPTHVIANADGGREITCEVSVDNGATTASTTSAPVSVAAAQAAIQPNTFDFGETRVGDAPGPQTFLIENLGGVDLEVGQVSSDNPEFPLVADLCSNATVAPGNSCRIEVGFEPASSGDHSAAISAGSNGGEVSAIVEGTGTEAVFTIAPTSHDFGAQRLGSASTATDFVVGNEGTASLTIDQVELQGADPGDFELEGDDCLGETLQPGEECTVSVAFVPADLGARAAVLTFDGDDQGSATLDGTGTAAAIHIAPAALQFGEVPVGAGPSTPQTVTISNAGTASLQLGTLAVVGADAASFSVLAAGDACSGETLEPGEECEAEVGFEPQADGVLSALLVVPGDAPSATVALDGTGTVPQFSVAPGAADFGEVEVGERSAARELTVTNIGTGPMTIGTVAVTGADPGQFALAGADTCSNATLGASEECTVAVLFAPTATATATATISFPGDAPGTAQLSGIGAAPPAPPAPAADSTPSATSTPPPPAPPRVKLKLDGGPVPVDANGVVKLRLACESAAGTACSATLKLLRSGSDESLPQQFGKWSGKVSAGATKTVKVSLAKAVREALAGGGKLKAIAQLNGSGGKSQKKITLKGS